ncbi:hypothetical protein F0562_025277 [Nyssa sinensis]|uniref:Plastid lipid-associated protein/fibrillin conserved domain-containing protein n=1 Tax=Nyssa sinensis TaxID=561372 RepID=A0A5J5BEZ8_9ASTE|nr:hypothetical protein F0562_025277 [Nyssa sinensis]
MGAPTAFFSCAIPSSSHTFLKPSTLALLTPLHIKTTDTPFLLKITNINPLRFSTAKIRATLDEKDQNTTTPLLVQEEEQLDKEVVESVKVIKNAAKTRRVAAEEVLSALSVIEKSKLDPSGFLEKLGGSKSPGRTWMLIFTAKSGLKSGGYVPITAVQRFDAAGKRIENGVYLGPIGFLTFEGRFSWKKRILSFIFERIRIKIGPFNPFELKFGGKDEREPSTKDPFFIWFYTDEEIAVARGKSGGTAFWCRCHRVSSY